jgi:hypothetical protein
MQSLPLIAAVEVARLQHCPLKGRALDGAVRADDQGVGLARRRRHVMHHGDVDSRGLRRELGDRPHLPAPGRAPAGHLGENYHLAVVNITKALISTRCCPWRGCRPRLPIGAIPPVDKTNAEVVGMSLFGTGA